ncbi:unnamed protein product [Arabis nemorensis]|uniref:BSD domain-containing protein n=1 Tax=Arabis nemorensis TaxID=586526 RepID=A0A565B8M6_9BRAS|nr:unnamed protein product [Arabis nemorensis]
MHTCRDFINKDIARCEEESKKSAASTSSEQLSIEELELRFKLLRENSELQRLHKLLVGGKVLTDDEFWDTRKELLCNDSIRKWKQQVGLKNVMISGIKPSTDGQFSSLWLFQTNKVTFNLTPEIIFQISAEKPAVRQAFRNYVPSKDSRDYFESQQGNVLNEPRGGSGAPKRNIHEAYTMLKRSISEITTTGLSDPLIKPEVAFEDAREWQVAHQGAKENCKAPSKPRTQGPDRNVLLGVECGFFGELRTRATPLCIRVPPRTGSSPQHSLLKV